MTRRRWTLALAAVAGAVGFAAWTRSPAAADPDGPEAGVRKNASDYTKAFDAGDATAAAACWTADGEYTDPDGDTFRGRAAIAAEFAAFFRDHPKATIEIAVESVRPHGRHAARVEGAAKTTTPGGPAPVAARFSGVFVREDDGWKIVTLRDWVPPAADAGTVADLGWLAGEWAAAGEAGDLRVAYQWNDAKTFLNGTYTLTKGGQAVGSGAQVIGTRPGGGVRSWLFDGTGATADAVWTRDGDVWAVEAAVAAPDGSEVTAVNRLVRVGPDAFTWQATARTADGVGLPDEPPVKVTRVKPK